MKVTTTATTSRTGTPVWIVSWGPGLPQTVVCLSEAEATKAGREKANFFSVTKRVEPLAKIPFSQVQSAIEEFESEVAYREANSWHMESLNQAFFDACENQNWYGTDDYSIAAREMMIEWLNENVLPQSNPLSLLIATSLFE